VLIFKKNGENEVPVTHPVGMKIYAGETPILPAMTAKYGTFDQLKEKYKNWKDHQTNKLAHIIWQRYASSVWDDVRIDNVVKFKEGRDEDDEKHVHPLQKDVYHRLIELYSNPGETMLEPFGGVGSGCVCSIEMGRKCISIELKESYFKQHLINVKSAKPLGFYDEDNGKMNLL
jgi:DNA modification methylase